MLLFISIICPFWFLHQLLCDLLDILCLLTAFFWQGRQGPFLPCIAWHVSNCLTPTLEWCVQNLVSFLLLLKIVWDYCMEVALQLFVTSTQQLSKTISIPILHNIPLLLLIQQPDVLLWHVNCRQNLQVNLPMLALMKSALQTELQCGAVLHTRLMMNVQHCAIWHIANQPNCLSTSNGHHIPRIPEIECACLCQRHHQLSYIEQSFQLWILWARHFLPINF